MSDPTVTVDSLTALASLQGLDIAIVAARVGISPTLIERVDAGRQGFPKSKARPLAVALGVSVGTVLAAAKQILDDAAMPVSLVARPLPPNPLFGEVFPTAPVNVTTDRNPALPAPTLLVWTVGQDVGNVGAMGGFERINRNTATILPAVAVTNVQEPISLARGETALYTVGTQSSGGNPYVAAIARNGALLFERLIDTVEIPYAIEYEPVCACLWVSLGTCVVRLNSGTGEYVGDVDLIYLGNTYTPRGIHATGGKIYVAAYRVVSESDAEGRLFEIDPFTATITRVSTGADMHFANDVVFDGTSTFYVVSRTALGSPAPGLYVVTLSTFSASLVTLSGGAALVNPTWVIYAFSHVFVSEADGSNTPRLVKITPGGVIADERAFAGTGTLGKPDADPWLLWVPNPSDGTVTMLEPVALDDLLSIDVGGAPQAVRIA
jgi:hypothetical protein